MWFFGYIPYLLHRGTWKGHWKVIIISPEHHMLLLLLCAIRRNNIPESGCLFLKLLPNNTLSESCSPRNHSTRLNRSSVDKSWCIRCISAHSYSCYHLRVLARTLKFQCWLFTLQRLLINHVAPKVNCNRMSIFDVQGSEMETSPLLHQTTQTKQKTPLPKLQIGILMLVQMAEPIACMSIYPYINQV